MKVFTCHETKWLRCPDADQQREADVQMKTLTVALSGAVAVVAHIDNNILHVASTGDCTAVIGTLSDTVISEPALWAL